MRALGVVLAHPVVECGLRLQQGRERARRRRAARDAGSGGSARSCPWWSASAAGSRRWTIALWRQILVEEHLAAGREARRELLAVVGEDSLGRPEARERLGQGQAHGAARGALDDAGDHAEARVVVESGDDARHAQLAGRGVDEGGPEEDVDLPQRHGRRALPAHVVGGLAPARSSRHEPVATQDPVEGRARGQPIWRGGTAHELVQDAQGAPRRVAAAQLADPRLERGRGPVRARLRAVRAIDEAGQALAAVAHQPRVDGLTRHAGLGGHVGDARAVQHRRHRSIPLLDNGQRHQRQSRPPAQSARADHGRRQASTEARVSSITRDRTHARAVAGEEFLYDFKGGLRPPRRAAGGRWRPSSPPPANGRLLSIVAGFRIAFTTPRRARSPSGGGFRLSRRRSCVLPSPEAQLHCVRGDDPRLPDAHAPAPRAP